MFENSAKKKKKQLKLKLERIEQNHMNRKIKMSKQNKYWKKSVQNVQRMPNELEKKRARQTDEEKCKERAKNAQRMREKRARQADEEKHTNDLKNQSNERDEGQTNS